MADRPRRRKRPLIDELLTYWTRLSKTPSLTPAKPKVRRADGSTRLKALHDHLN